ncbi:uncharacterized protein LOC144195207 [Stigmatopora nigra]
MLVHNFLILVALFSPILSSDPNCEELVVSLEDRNLISGKWIFYAGTSDNEDFLDEFKSVSSSWIELSLLQNSENFTMTWSDKIEGNCSFDNVTSTFSNSSSNVQAHYITSEEIHAETYLKTCPDCLLLIDKMAVQVSDLKTLEGRVFALFTRSGRLDDTHLDVFKKQAACLKFTGDLHFGDTTDLCQEENP